jgi:site-specific DNA-methyltransferase (adenine-specific)
MSSRNKSQIELQKPGKLPSAQVPPSPCCVQPFSVRTDAVSELYNMDCVEGMKHYPDNHFDLAICDPPYGNETKADVGTGGYSRKTLNNKKGNWDCRPNTEYFIELFRVSKNQIIWGANFFDLPPSRGWLCWYKTNEVKGRDFSEFELAFTSFNKPARHFEYKPFIRDGQRIHPTQKPLQLYNWILKNYAETDAKILDTHVGSGSSRIACYLNGFDFVGFEIDEEYCQKSEKRFVDAISQQRLF